MAIRVAIVEDNPGILNALEEVLRLDDNFEWAGSYATAASAIEDIPELLPDVVLMDINLGSTLTGIDCVKKLKPLQPSVLYLMCTVYEEDDKIFDALKAGASGYILKKTQPQKLLEAIRELYEGGAPMSSQIARKVVTTFQEKKDKGLEELSPREREILEHLAKGLLYKEISAELGISQETVRKHVYNIYEKLHVSNRVEAINKLYGR
ncbi:MAG: DNA-binding response regulator [Chitinophagaceae bacterium]|jgi:RNA polymerase sigma factor (sigma-70 family)|nr:DNA-binding response regulator [Chitinophagaceae bacterium]